MYFPSVSSTTASTAADAVSQIGQVSQVSSTTTPTTTQASASSGDSSSVSGFGKLLSKLSDLEKNDPAQAKQVLENIASKLQAAAAETTGDQASRLSSLAEKFSSAASTGDLSGLQPPQQSSTQASGGHHHHHGHAAYAQAQTQGDSSQDDATLDAVAASL